MGKMVTNTLFGNVYANKKVLITGHTGFKGSWLTAWLLRMGAQVYGISKDVPTQPSLFEVLGLQQRITHYTADVRNAETVQKIIHEVRPNFVFHLAAQPIVLESYKNPADTIATNVMGTTNVLEALRVLNLQCTAIVITSDKCYDNVEWLWGYKETDALGGKDVYSGSKGAAELVCKCYYHSFFSKPTSQVRIATARAGNVIGGGDWAINRIVPDCMRAWSEGRIVEIRSPQATRPWQHVLEPLSGYLLLGQALHANAALNGENFNLGPKTERSYTVQTILQDLSQCWHFANPQSAYKIIGDVAFHEAGLLKLNCDKALLALNWTATLDYKTLIDFTGDWYYQFYNPKQDMFACTMKQIETYEELAKQQQQQWIQNA
ncbi:CDP-glucose 4,6-dehydratase [Bacteroidia bacterium]|nr:CDP-glucose 4,6-dehydratase [Bacteroidia bacterium]